MAQLIRYSDNVYVEIAENPDRAVAVAGKSSERIGVAFQDAADALDRILRPMVESVRRTMEQARVTECEIELGLGLTLEGNLYVTKASSSANLTVRAKVDRSR